jgi:hypothetical protein
MELTKDQKIAQQVIAEVWNNPSFKKELMDSPFEAIKKLTGETIKLPAGVQRLEVVDQTDSTCSYFNIPAPPNMDDVELTDDQLEAVAGGNGSGGPPPPLGIFGVEG